ncbi:cyanoexosortase A [Cyanothece sp. BG0011]|uniref:cyanoexosortase A n=1 Tax=Cyanothece sp. BG0011 TaxID=2082950 RepID=UPI000D1E5A7D|nr:cyanoexosortase A [Cyanothece sp. BG0011]
MEILQKLGKPSYLLLGIIAAITALHFTLLEQEGNQNLISVSLLIWLTAASLLWDKYQEKEFYLESNLPSTVLGIILILIALLRSLSTSGYHFFLCPVLFAFGLVLITSGFKGFQFYKKEVIVFSLFLLYPALLKVLAMSNLDIWTSMFSTFLLNVLGFEASRDGTFISLPTGKVEVLYGCAGVDILSLMVICSILLFFIVPLTNPQKILCLFLAPLIGFVVNSIRVCLLTFFVAQASDEAFHYWHGEDGSLAFAMISVILFGIFCWFSYVRPLSLENQD